MRAVFHIPLFLTGMACAESPKVEWTPLTIGGMHEIGQLQKGVWKDIGEPFKDEWLDRVSSYFTQSALIENRLKLEVGLGGVFVFPKPEVPQAQFGGSQWKGFFIGPTVALGTWYSSDPATARFSLGMGMFPFKYNPEAQNLGEYLFRSGPYPTFITTGGFSTVGVSSATLQGFHGRARLGNFSFNALFTTETNLPPLYDWSLALLGRYDLMQGLLVVGGGVNFKRLIQVRTSRTNPESEANSYFQHQGTWYPGNPELYTQKVAFSDFKLRENAGIARAILTGLQPNHPALLFLDEFNLNLDSARVYAAGSPSALASIDAAINNRSDAIASQTQEDSITAWSTLAGANRKYFSSAGTLLMGHATLDLKKAVHIPGMRENDLKVFGEIALLGIKNYPVYYTKRTQRLPMMAGINLPSWGLFDRISIQYEYFNAPYANNFLSLGNARATPFFPSGGNPEFSQAQYYDAAQRDNTSWSVFLTRTLLPGITVNAQFARDHLRTVGTDWFFGSRLEPNEILHLSKNWYWMLKIGWDI